jgi:hypothetical protein
MKSSTRLSYLPIEIQSYLPTGWELPEAGAPKWDAAKGAWSATLVDGADVEWPVVVRAADAAKVGRLPALKKAIDDVYRDRLGPSTRGLGLG